MIQLALLTCLVLSVSLWTRGRYRRAAVKVGI